MMSPITIDSAQPRDPFKKGESEAEQTAMARHRVQPRPEPATEPTYLEIARLVALHGQWNGNFSHWEGRVVRAGCEWLGHQLERPATLTEVRDFFGQPWREVLAILEAYPPVLPLITYTLYLRAFSEAHSQPGSSHAEGVVGTAHSIVQASLDYLEQQRQDAERQAEYARVEAHISEQREASRKRAMQEQLIESAVGFMGAALFGSVATVAVLTYLGLLH